MQVLQVIAQETTDNFYTSIVQKERSLRGKGTTFIMQKRDIWKHSKYPGRIKIHKVSRRILSFEIQTRAEGKEWQMTHAFVGYLNRHFSSNIDQISIFFM